MPALLLVAREIWRAPSYTSRNAGIFVAPVGVIQTKWRAVTMTPSFAESVAFMVWADLYRASTPYVGAGLPNGQMVSFSDTLVMLSDGASQDHAFQDAVPLDFLSSNEEAARKLAGWLGALLGGDSGVEHFESGWSAWATREDGKVLEVAAFGYQLYEDKEGFLSGGQCVAALRGGYEDAG